MHPDYAVDSQCYLWQVDNKNNCRSSSPDWSCDSCPTRKESEKGQTRRKANVGNDFIHEQLYLQLYVSYVLFLFYVIVLK